MVLKDYESPKLILEDLKKIIEEIENPDNELHKFINTQIYHCFKYDYNMKKSKILSSQTPQRHPRQ